MQRRLVETAVVMAIEGWVGLQAPQYLVFAALVGSLYLLWTWDVLPNFVAKFHDEERTLSLGDIRPVSAPENREVTKHISSQAPPAGLNEQQPVEAQLIKEFVKAELKDAPDLLSKDVISIAWKSKPPKLELVVTNHTPDVLLGVHVEIKDILWWSDKTETFCKTAQFHNAGDGQFVSLNLGMVDRLFHDRPIGFLFLTADKQVKTGRLSGNASGGRQATKDLQRNGRYQVFFRIGDKQGRRRVEPMCFRFDPDKFPEPCECYHVKLAPPPISPLRV
jgi:hypothetical protein